MVAWAHACRFAAGKGPSKLLQTTAGMPIFLAGAAKTVSIDKVKDQIKSVTN
jgi:hypothetical protein